MSSIRTTAKIDLESYAHEFGRKARSAAKSIALTSTDQKNEWLRRLAARIQERSEVVLRANQRDVQAAFGAKLAVAQIDRLRLDSSRMAALATALNDIALLPDPVGETIEKSKRPNGLEIRKVRVPLGVVLFIYESRPNVTIDAAALCVKSGNAVILRGGREAFHTNQALHSIVTDSLSEVGLDHDSVQMVKITDRAIVNHLLHMNQSIDLVIPRGGPDLIGTVANEARMPVMKHFAGICHVYVHRAASHAMAESIVLNSKCQRPGVCNAAECLLVDSAIASEFLPPMIAALEAANVKVRGCATTQKIVPGVELATDVHFATEYLDLEMSVRVVDDIAQAIEHISRFGSAHTDTIVTEDPGAATTFTRQVDSAAVLVNASTRFNDGGEFGLGAEIGISTDKFHARGPCGLRELTSYKYVVQGQGQIRS